jgi:hypothetical protein
MSTRQTKLFGNILVLVVCAVLAFAPGQLLGQKELSKTAKQYSVVKVVSSAGTEYRLMYSAPDTSLPSRHFLSVIVAEHVP